MLRLRPDRAVANLLAVGAHADDVEIGAGATVLRLLAEHPGIAVTWVVLAASGARADEARSSAAAFLERAGHADVRVHDFRDGFLPYEGGAVKDTFEALKHDVEPDLVLAPRRADAHQDHRLVAELVWNTFRDHLVLEYEIPKYDGDLASPNVFVAVDEATCARKIELLQACFPSQAARAWFTADTFRGLMRLRGVEGNVATGLAEGFWARKVVW